MIVESIELENNVSKVVSQYFPQAKVQNIKVIESGHINATYRVDVFEEEGKEASYLLQKLNTEVFKNPNSVMENINRCARFLHDFTEGYPYEILTPYKTEKEGSFLVKNESGYWRLFNFVENTISLDKITTGEEAFQIGNAFGTFLFYVNGDNVTEYNITIPNFHDFTSRYAQFVKFLKPYDIKKFDSEVQNLILEIEGYSREYINLDKVEIPLRLIHHDTKANNVLLDESTGSPKCIIDLDTLMPGSIFSDFGDLIRTVLNPFEEDNFLDNNKKIDINIFNNLSKGFLLPLNEILTNNEKDYLIKGGKRIILLQVLRFLEDYLRGNIYYQVDYDKHNLIRAQSQMNLFKAIERTELSLH
ncbi:phosphotransferase enzyme family protein [Membranihabitans maritimus]|uniref:phosphotransferase enzyme family protein n=1 Tax=Membranihabitans maritimus TaxID=2904244 RepID=UPI001F30C170|nr:phosphotransferase [Membranihabitans maritimus]